MPQPALIGTHRICTFGGLGRPNGQGVMVPVDLNDLVSWFLQDEALFDVQEQIALAQQAYLGEGAFLSSDFPPLPLRVPMEYREGATPLGAVLPQLLLAGEQQLTFDNSTGILVRCLGTRNKATSWRMRPLRWTFDLMFIAREPWWRDLVTSTYINALALNGAGVATTTNVAYSGSVWAKPVFTLSIPNTNPAPIASFVLTNTMSGETLTVAFPGNLAASTTWAITIDSGAMSVTDATGKAYDVSGSFPLLYGPAGQVQQISATLTPASGTATGCTLTAVATNRWLL